MSWSSRRQFAYAGTVTGIIALFALAFVYKEFFTTPPTCFDGKQNGTETGIDCGGSCALICKGDAHAPVVLWARSFETASSTYTAAAYIQNPQAAVAGAYNVHYDFRLLDADNNLIVETPPRSFNLPPEQTVPLVESNINVGSRTVAHTFLQFLDDIAWTKIPHSALPSVRVVDEVLAQDGTRLTATVVNDGTLDVRDLTVNAVLFDASGTARQASKSVIARIPGQGKQDIVFTWPQARQDIVRAEIIPVPSVK